MVVLRATAKVRRSLPPASPVAEPSHGALGDWYVNRLVVDRQPLLLLVSSCSLLAILTPGRNVRTLPDRLPAIITRRLQRLGVPASVIAAEAATLTPVRVARTADQSVLGTLVNFTKELPYHLPIGGWDETSLPFLELRLGETPCHAPGDRRSNYHALWPARDAVRLLMERWNAANGQR
jgi:hypothetical protein